MPINSDKIIFCMKLPNALYRKLHEVTKEAGESKASFCRRVLQRALNRILRANRQTP